MWRMMVSRWNPATTTLQKYISAQVLMGLSSRNQRQGNYIWTLMIHGNGFKTVRKTEWLMSVLFTCYLKNIWSRKESRAIHMGQVSEFMFLPRTVSFKRVIAQWDDFLYSCIWSNYFPSRVAIENPLQFSHRRHGMCGFSELSWGETCWYDVFCVLKIQLCCDPAATGLEWWDRAWPESCPAERGLLILPVSPPPAHPGATGVGTMACLASCLEMSDCPEYGGSYL